MDSLNKDSVIKEILSVKYFEPEILESKDIESLILIRFSKKMTKNINQRLNYEEKLNNLDPEHFNKHLLKNCDFAKIKEYYYDYVVNKILRLQLINDISDKTLLTKERLTKWSTKRMKDKLNSINLRQEKEIIMNNLQEYGDGITKISTPKHIQKQRYNFLIINGTTENSEIRYILSKRISQILKKLDKRPIYKDILTKDIEILKSELYTYQKDYHRNKLIKYLSNYEYETKFLKKQKLYVLEYLKSDLQPCEKGSRTDLIRLLASRNIWSRNTIRNWDIDKLKHSYIKCIQDSYSPLSEYVPNRPLTKTEKEKQKNKSQHPRLDKSREEILKDITETLFIDLIGDTS